MKVTIIANISANGRVLFSENPHYETLAEAMNFYVGFVRKVGNVVIGMKTFENFKLFPDEVKKLFDGIEILILSNREDKLEGYKIVKSPEEAVEYISSKGLNEIAVGGGAATFNAFLDMDLVTDVYLNINPLITGYGNTLVSNSRLNVKYSLKDHIEKNGFIRMHLSKDIEEQFRN